MRDVSLDDMPTGESSCAESRLLLCRKTKPRAIPILYQAWYMVLDGPAENGTDRVICVTIYDFRELYIMCRQPEFAAVSLTTIMSTNRVLRHSEGYGRLPISFSYSSP